MNNLTSHTTSSKFFPTMFIAILLAMFVALPAGAQESVKKITFENIKYELFSNGEATLIDGTKAEGNIVVPEQVEYKEKKYTVTRIGYTAFCKYDKYNEKPTGIQLPNTIREIEKRAFKDCRYLQHVNIPNSVTSIANETFSGCYNLTSITIPDGVTTIGVSAFESCLHITTIRIPNTVTSIGKDAFSGCRDLEEVIIPDKEPKAETGIMGIVFDFSNNIKTVRGNTIECPDYAYKFKKIRIDRSKNGVNVNRSGGWFESSCPFIKETLPKIANQYRHTAKLIKEGIEDDMIISDVGEILFSNSSKNGRCKIYWFDVSADKKYLAVIHASYDYRIGNKGSSFTLFDLCDTNIKRIDIGYSSFSKEDLSYNKENFKKTNILKFSDFYYIPSTNKKYKTEALALQAAATITPPKPKYPPLLNIEPNSITLADPSGNNAINANESCKIMFKVTNSGKGAANNCIAKISTTAPGVKVADVTLSTIPAGETVSVEIPVSSDINITDGVAQFGISVYEPNGFGTDTQTLNIDTRGFNAPLVKMTDYAVSNAPDGKIQKRSSFDLQLLVQNVKHGAAENVQVEVKVPQDVYITSGETKAMMGSLTGGTTRELKYEIMVSGNYKQPTIPVEVAIREKYGKYAESQTLHLPIGEKISSNVIAIKSKKENNSAVSNIAIAHIDGKKALSDVDVNIPKAGVVNSKTFAIVIANENYQEVSRVDNAINDGTVFAEYCTKTLGLPETNVHLVTDATYINMKREVNWLKQVAQTFGGEAKIIVYYAGHGIPDEKTQSSYLLPVDGLGTDVSTGLSLHEFYQTLGSIPAQSVTVFLDACFSGATRDGGMMAAARGVAIKAKTEVPQGKLVVLSAAQGDETAYPYKEKNHGLFTYYLLKKLQSTNGEATMGQISDYVKENVSRQSIIINGKSQTPTLNAATSIRNNWQNWKLK